MTEPEDGSRRLAGVREEGMRELALAEGMRQAEHAVSADHDRTLAAEEFAERLAEYAGLAFRVARAVLHNTADAEDVAQEAFLRAHRNASRLRDRESFRAWLVRVAFRLALDRTRTIRRRERRETDWARSRPEVSPEDAAASGEMKRRVREALEKLPEKSRLVLILTAIEGHSLVDVAEILGIPEGTVKSRLHIGRKQLAEQLRWLADNTKTR